MTFEEWFATLPKASQQIRFTHSLYMREAWDASRKTAAPEDIREPRKPDLSGHWGG